MKTCQQGLNAKGMDLVEIWHVSTMAGQWISQAVGMLAVRVVMWASSLLRGGFPAGSIGCKGIRQPGKRQAEATLLCMLGCRGGSGEFLGCSPCKKLKCPWSLSFFETRALSQPWAHCENPFLPSLGLRLYLKSFQSVVKWGPAPSKDTGWEQRGMEWQPVRHVPAISRIPEMSWKSRMQCECPISISKC